MTIKPFSAYTEARDELLALCRAIEKAPTAEDHVSPAIRLADQVNAILTDEAFGEHIEDADAAALDVLLTPRHVDEYHEDMGPVVWWRIPITEAPLVGWKEESFPPYEWFTPLPTNDHIGLIQKRIEVVSAKRSEVAA
jgi:hypothetical protein